MKKLLFLLGSVFVITGLVMGETTVVTKPVGFQTATLKASQTNLLGINFVNAPLVAGSIDAEAASSITDNDVDFTVSLVGQLNIVVEITSGTYKGIASRVASISQHTLVTGDDLSAYLAPGDTYEVRAAHTVASLFGATNSAGLKPGSATTADVVWIPNGSGGFTKIYYASAAPPFTTAGWKSVGGGNTDRSSTPVYHVDALLIERRGTTDLEVTFTGTIRKTPTFYGAVTGFNYFDSVYPTGATLANSGLSATVKHGNATTADVVWMPNGTGGWNRYYYATSAPPFTTAGWKSVGGGNTDRSTTPITSGFILERRGVAATVTTIPDPAIYGGL